MNNFEIQCLIEDMFYECKMYVDVKYNENNGIWKLKWIDDGTSIRGLKKIVEFMEDVILPIDYFTKTHQKEIIELNNYLVNDYRLNILEKYILKVS